MNVKILTALVDSKLKLAQGRFAVAGYRFVWSNETGKFRIYDAETGELYGEYTDFDNAVNYMRQKVQAGKI